MTPGESVVGGRFPLGRLAITRGAAVFRRHRGPDACDVIVAPGREAGRVALSRVAVEDIRLSLAALVPEDRARLAEELRDPRVP